MSLAYILLYLPLVDVGTGEEVKPLLDLNTSPCPGMFNTQILQVQDTGVGIPQHKWDKGCWGKNSGTLEDLPDIWKPEASTRRKVVLIGKVNDLSTAFIFSTF